MKIYAINGSPRKNGNTAKMCQGFLDGAASAGAETKLVNLSDLKFTGCKSCFGCKLNGKTYGTCIVRDDLFDLLGELKEADGIALGSPIYFGDTTALMRCFIERFLFPSFTYEEGYRSIAPKRFPVTMIYTMNVTEDIFRQLYHDRLAFTEQNFIGHTCASEPVRRVCAFNTYQFGDYSRYKVTAFSESVKREWRDTQFPRDLQAAYDEGHRMAGGK